MTICYVAGRRERKSYTISAIDLSAFSSSSPSSLSQAAELFILTDACPFSALGLLSLRTEGQQGIRQDLSYLLAGQSSTIKIQNATIEEPVNNGENRMVSESKKIMMKPETTAWQFNYLGTVSRNGEKDLEQFIVASHNLYGIIQVPVKDFLRKDTVIINNKTEQLNHSHDLIRARVIDNRVYASRGNRIYEENVSGELEQLAKQFPAKEPLFQLPEDEQITCFDVVGEEERKQAWVGTRSGRVYLVEKGETAKEARLLAEKAGKIVNIAVIGSNGSNNEAAYGNNNEVVFNNVDTNNVSRMYLADTQKCVDFPGEAVNPAQFCYSQGRFYILDIGNSSLLIMERVIDKSLSAPAGWISKATYALPVAIDGKTLLIDEVGEK